MENDTDQQENVEHIEKTVKLKEEKEFDACSESSSLPKKSRLRRKVITKYIESDDENEPAPNLKCPKCKKQFYSKTGVLNHMLIHGRKYTCALCEIVFNTNTELRKHKLVHKDEDRVFLCHTCEEAFSNHCDYLIHQVTHQKPWHSHKCVECGVHKTPKDINMHIKSHFNEYDHECAVCKKKFQSKSSRNEHMKLHQTGTIECVECGKLLKNNKQYLSHMDSHIGLKKFQCLYCGQGFYHPSAVTVHARKHTLNMPFRCDICSRAFYQQTDWKRHKDTHDRTKKYKCDMCDKEFRLQKSLQDHLKYHTKTDLLYCPVCNKPCQNSSTLRVHTLYVHTDKKNYKCDFCNMAFKMKAKLDRHNKSKTHQRALFEVGEN